MMHVLQPSENYTDHDSAIAALFEQKSLDALRYLIDHGRELEFSYAGENYFISRSNAQKYVSLWGNGTQQSFDSVPTLIDNATLQQTPFRTAWMLVVLQYLF